MKILCLGDSLTYGFRLSSRETWAGILERTLGHTWINHAVCGNTTGGMLASFREELHHIRPDIVILQGGENDLIYGNDLRGAKANLGAMVHLAMAEYCFPVLGTPVPLCQPLQSNWERLLSSGETASQLCELRSWMLKASDVFSCGCVDFYGSIEQAVEQGQQLSELYLSDGLHPNQKGHAKMAEAAELVFQGLMKTIHDRV